MRKVTFAVVLSLGVAMPIVASGVALTRPSVRAWLSEFVAPLPASTVRAPESSIAALPPQLAITGAESSELHALALSDAGPPTNRAPRTALFPCDIPIADEVYQRPRGLKRSELASRDDVSIDLALRYLALDPRGHDDLVAAVQRSGRFRDEVDRVLRAWKVPPGLAAIPFVESGFAPTATSLDGGVGLWSLPREVAQAYGLAVLPKYDERRGFALSSEAAAHYLADLHERLGSWELTILAFGGGGYAKTLATLQQHTSLDYWDVAGELPVEATTYVDEVLAVATILGNPDRFRLDGAKLDEPLVTSDLEVPADATFSLLARAAGTTVQRLHELNPEYLGESIPSTGFAMAIHLPSASLARAKELVMPLMYAPGGGGGAGYVDRVSDAGNTDPVFAPTPVAGTPSRAGSRGNFYHVQDGDTLESVSRRFSVPRETIASDNALDPSAALKVGELLIVRTAPAAEASTSNVR